MTQIRGHLVTGFARSLDKISKGSASENQEKSMVNLCQFKFEKRPKVKSFVSFLRHFNKVL